LFFNLPSLIPEFLTHPSTHEVLQAKERAPTPFPSVVFFLGLVTEFIKEFGGALVEEAPQFMIVNGTYRIPWNIHVSSIHNHELLFLAFYNYKFHKWSLLNPLLE
jgi:hypothetical protein